MIRAFGLILLLLAAPFAMAQDTPEPATDIIGPPVADSPPSPIAGIDYTAWERTAQRSAAISESGNGSPFALERMRSDLVQWRDQFLAVQGTNAARIATVRQQLATLGEPPAEPAVEDPLVAARRATLQAELARLRAPLLLAQEAYAGANGLISEIDSLLRTRRAGALTARGVSPLNPLHWPEVAADLGNLSVSLGKEMRVTFTSASAERAQGAPGAGGLQPAGRNAPAPARAAVDGAGHGLGRAARLARGSGLGAAPVPG